MSSDAIAEGFLSFSASRMQRSEREINACLDRLSDAQILYRGGDHENSIANLLLHLAGNMRQWVLHGMGGQPNVRQRDGEFALAVEASVAEIRSRFAATIGECRTVIAEMKGERLMEIIDPQPGSGWEAMTILEGICQVVGHLQLHTGQIILLTKQYTRSDLDLTIPRKR